MSAAALASTILVFVAIVAIGAILRATGLLGEEDSRVLNAVIIYVGLPAFIFQAIHKAALSPALLGVVAIAWIVFALTAGVGWVVARSLKLERPAAGGFILAAALGNTGYIGYPIAAAIFGQKPLVDAVFYDVFGTVFALVLVGLVIAQRFGAAEATRPVNPLVELATFPAVIALAAGLLLRPVPITGALSHGLDVLASMVAPLIMLSVGLSLRPRAVARYAVPLAAVVVLRLVLAPALALGIGHYWLSGDLLRLAVLQAGMPAMMLTLVVGGKYELETDFIAAAIFVTTAAAAVTIPLWQLLAFR